MAKRKRKGFSFWKPKGKITSKGLKVTPPRARIGGKAGINVSKSGISGSARTKHGTASTRRGCSIIPGCVRTRGRLVAAITYASGQ